MRKWEELYKKIGPLRYQSSTSDCVSTTLVNGLTLLLERKLEPKLLKLIWGLSLDREEKIGTGYVCCDVLPFLLTKWFERAWEDEYEKGRRPLPFTSIIIKDNEVHLEESGRIRCCLESGGVVCVSDADHYYLILGIEKEKFLGFDCWWDKKMTPKRLESLGSYKGLVNRTWTRAKLKLMLEEYPRAHLLSKQGDGDAP